MIYNITIRNSSRIPPGMVGFLQEHQESSRTMWGSVKFSRDPSMAFDNLQNPSKSLEIPSNPFDLPRSPSKPLGPLALLRDTPSLDPSGPTPSTKDFELLERQFEPFRISRLIS